MLFENEKELGLELLDSGDCFKLILWNHLSFYLVYWFLQVHCIFLNQIFQNFIFQNIDNLKPQIYYTKSPYIL